MLEGAGSIATRPKTTRVVSAHTSVLARLQEIWRSRELLLYLVRTEIKVKYKNSFLGLLWSMVSPSLTLAVYAMVFGVFLHNGMPEFVIYLFSGLLLWNFFSTGILTSTGVIVNNAGLVKKVSFPREILALAAVGSAGVFFFFQACVMVLFLVVLQWAPAWSLLYLVVVALIPTLVLACALGILLAAVNVYMRDTQHLVTVLVGSAWFWACPIVYTYQTVGPRLAQHGLAWLYFLNPMTVLVMTFQRTLYGRLTVRNTQPPHGVLPVLPHWPLSTYVWGDGIVLAFGLLLFYVAMVVFGRLAGNFAEEL
ncbi:MAG: ABC transporter permease [Actinomycetota bacterium]|nr:ABC transporter permease [Actinomycetota bacterium]